MIEVKDLIFSFDDHILLDRVSFELEKGEIASIIGGAGAGKSTLFGLLNGSLPLQQGSISVNEDGPQAAFKQWNQEEKRRPFLLLDEPFAGKDDDERYDIVQSLKTLNYQHKTTILIATQFVTEALAISNKVFLLAQGQIARSWKIDTRKKGEAEYMGGMLEEMHTVIENLKD